MENQHRKIAGYRELSAEEIDLVNKIKDAANGVGGTIAAVATVEGVDQRALAIAKTELQTGFMWLIRSITKPAGF